MKHLLLQINALGDFDLIVKALENHGYAHLPNWQVTVDAYIAIMPISSVRNHFDSLLFWIGKPDNIGCFGFSSSKTADLTHKLVSGSDEQAIIEGIEWLKIE
ncbi:hypothetical protein KBC03_08410 [Patescibacteria group bacterium]|nr:hypothetical protein [Patescibacteria group bacterium]